MPDYLGRELQRGVEAADRSVLLVRWRSLEPHEVGFRGARQYRKWRVLPHHFYDPFPTMRHCRRVDGVCTAPA